MTRVEFTRLICNLIEEMIYEGENPIIDYVLRSTEEQKRLFDKGLSKCDGVEKRSAHQSAKAMDIYFIEDGEMVDPKMGWEFWHKAWEKRGGKPMISWDRGHFE